MNPIIKLENVTFSYNNKCNQLENIQLSINEGECVLITGSSGCGKTTLTRLINGLVPHHFEGSIEGSVFINGENAMEFESWQYGKISGSVFQDARSQFFTSRVLDELAFASENYGYESEQIKKRIEHVEIENGIENLEKRSLSNLSSGEKQKIAMSAVQVHNPDIYVLDEPSANLDNNACINLAKALVDLKKQNKTIVIADHRIAYLMEVIDRVVYMDNGSIVAEYTVEEFKKLQTDSLVKLGLRSMQEVTLSDVLNSNKHETKEKSNLIIENLSIGYDTRSKALIENFSLKLDEGEIVALTGENGIGKTTLAKTLCGLIKEKTGIIELDGHALSLKKRRNAFWFVLQDTDYQLFSDSVINELLLGIKKDESNLMRAEKILADLDLIRFKEQHPASLSGGQKQRLTFAVGLMRMPQILILDEPTSGLDYKNMKRMNEMILKYASLGISFIIISHDYEFISNLNCRVLEIS